MTFTWGLVARLVGLGTLVSTIVGILASLLRCRRSDALTLLGLCLGAGVALLGVQPMLAVTDHSDYLHYLHALGTIEGVMPARPLFVWIAAGAPGFHVLWWLDGIVAATLPALAFLAAIAAGGGRSSAAAAGISLVVTAPLLLFAADANPVTPLAWLTTVSALALELFLRDPRARKGRASFVLAALCSALAFLVREEALFLAAAHTISLVATDRMPRRHRAIVVAAWLGLLTLFHALLSVRHPEIYAYTLHRFEQYSRRLGNHLWLALGTNALFVALPLVLWNHRERPILPRISSPLVLPVLVFTVVYLSGAAAQEHQIVVLPLLVPQTILALAALRVSRPRLASSLAALMGTWVLASTVGLAILARRSPRQREYVEVARGLPEGSVVHVAEAFSIHGEAPLEALLDDTIRIVGITPPEGCPARLFHALAFLQARCVENHGPLDACRRAVAQAGDDWVDQALALASLPELTPDDAAKGGGSKWFHAPGASLRGTRHASPRTDSARDGGDYFFVPFWARPDVLNDNPPGKLGSFRWLESARLSLDLPEGDLVRAPDALVRTRVRDALEGKALCDALRARPAGAALFTAVETRMAMVPEPR